MAIDDPSKVDLVTYDPKSTEFVLIMIADQGWKNTPDDRRQLEQKLNGYMEFIESGQFLGKFPEAAGKPIRIQLDCIGSVDVHSAVFFSKVTQLLQTHGYTFRVNRIDAEPT